MKIWIMIQELHEDKKMELCKICKQPMVDGNKCQEQFCYGADQCLICGQDYEVTEEYMVYGYCQDHEGDMPAVVLSYY